MILRQKWRTVRLDLERQNWNENEDLRSRLAGFFWDINDNISSSVHLTSLSLSLSLSLLSFSLSFICFCIVIINGVFDVRVFFI